MDECASASARGEHESTPGEQAEQAMSADVGSAFASFLDDTRETLLAIRDLVFSTAAELPATEGVR